MGQVHTLEQDRGIESGHDDPNVNLWVSVIYLALLDLRGHDEFENRRAYRWFFSPLQAEDFKTACGYANVVPEWVQGLARRALVLGPKPKPVQKGGMRKGWKRGDNVMKKKGAA